MNASSGATTIRLHGVLRFAVAVTAAFVIGEVMQWWPSFLAAVLVAVLLASLPVRPTPRMALGLVMVMTVVAWAPYLLASLLRGTPIVLFGPQQVKWAESLGAGSAVRMGQQLAAPVQA